MQNNRGNFVFGGHVKCVTYNEGSHTESLDQLDRAIDMLNDVKTVLKSESKSKKQAFWEGFQKEGLKFISETLSATIAALFANALK